MHEKTKRLLETSTHPLDQYPWGGNFPPPMPGRTVARFQERINRICGLAPNGKPAVRVIWPADPDESISMRVEAETGEKRARYTIYSEEYQGERTTESGIVIVETIAVDITPPRWMLEEYDERTDTYLHLRTIAHHDERCCEGWESIEGHLCYGLYREPMQSDLEDLQRRVKEREAFGERVQSDQPLTYQEQRAAIERLRNWRQHYEQTTRGKYKDAILSGLVPQAPRLFSDDPSVQKHGKYHFLFDKGAR